MNTCLYANDIDDYACKVYEKNWNDGTLHKEDIRNVTAADVCRRGIPAVICGGVPCQPSSRAGKQMFEADERWLWPEFFRLVSDIRPRYAVMENPSGIFDGGFGYILGALSDLRYDAEWQVMEAAAFGPPHRRERVFIVAYTNSFRCESSRNTKREHKDNMAEARKTAKDKQSGSKRFSRINENDAAVTNSQSQHRETWNMLETCEVGQSPEQLRRRDRVFVSERRRECPDWWETAPDICRVANGIPNQVDRIKCLGNAIVPQVAQYVGECIMAHNGGEFSFAELFAGIGGFRLGFENGRYEA